MAWLENAIAKQRKVIEQIPSPVPAGSRASALFDLSKWDTIVPFSFNTTFREHEESKLQGYLREWIDRQAVQDNGIRSAHGPDYSLEFLERFAARERQKKSPSSEKSRPSCILDPVRMREVQESEKVERSRIQQEWGEGFQRFLNRKMDSIANAQFLAGLRAPSKSE